MPQSTRLRTSSSTDLQDDQIGRSEISSNQNGALTTMNTPPDFSNDQIVQWLRTQWGGLSEGTTRSWSARKVTYFIGGTPYASGSPEADSTVGMTKLMQSRAALAFELWDDLISINITPSKTASYGQIQFEYASDTDNEGTYSAAWTSEDGTSPYHTTAYSITRNEIWINSSWTSQDTDADMYFGGYGFQTYLHEIGHALGLSHPGTYNSGGPISYWTDAEFLQDYRRYTVMSYFGGYELGAGWHQDGADSSWLYSSTPMVYDVLAIQAIYGADYTTRATDTVYGFNSTAGRDVYDFTKNPQPILTIWDGGGIDTLDASRFRTDQTIYLDEGLYSSIGRLRDNVAIAYGVEIENAIGGSGDDRIMGNDADNRLTGGVGDDVLQGVGGIDSAIFSGKFSQYAVTLLNDNAVIVAGPDGTDKLWYVEKMVFSDRTVASPSWRSVSVSDVTIVEGNKGTKAAIFTVASTGSAAPFAVNYGTRDGTATVSDGDYVATWGTLSFGAGDDIQTISVSISSDTKNEFDEGFRVELYAATQGVTVETQAIGTIINDDIQSGIVSIHEDVSVDEGDGVATFTVLRTGGLSPFSVNYATADDTAKVADGDYVATSGTLFFGEGVESQTISVTVNDDINVETGEYFKVILSKATNGAKMQNAERIGTIYDDDEAPGLVAISDATIIEGTKGTKTAIFTVTRTRGVSAFNVDYATADDTATTADGDYVATMGKLSFGAGIDSQTIAVRIKGDTRIETDETFKLNLSNATQYAFFSDAQGIGTITNDDFPPGSVSISDVTIAEGRSSTKVATFTVTRSGGTAAFSVDYATADGTATMADDDYVAAFGTLSFGNGVDSQTIAVKVDGDTKFEADETFRVNLSSATNGARISDRQAIGTITNDDLDPGTVAISDVRITEGDRGVKVATFAVTRTGGTTPFSVKYATVDGTATVADDDYRAASQTLSFGDGVESKAISIKINGDTEFEANETFGLKLSNATNGAKIGDGQANGFITNDDSRASALFRVGNVSWSDGNLVAGGDMAGDFVGRIDMVNLASFHASASHAAFVSMGASTMAPVDQNLGIFSPTIDLALPLDPTRSGSMI